MNISNALGLAGTMIGLVRAVPQLAKLLRTRKAHGVSVDTAATCAVVSFGWASYGLLTGQPFVSLATGSSGLVTAVVAVIALRFGRRVKEVKIAPVWLVVLALAWVIAGTNGLGALLPLSVLASNLPQLWVARRERDLSELSLGTWLLSLADGFVWGSYALFQHQLSVLVYGALQVTTCGLIVASKLASERRAARLRLSSGAS